MSKHWLSALAFALCACLMSCNSGEQAQPLSVGADPAAQIGSVDDADSPLDPPLRPNLPSPAALQEELAGQHSGPRSASYSPQDLLRLGSDFDAGLPAQRVSAAGDELVFDPQFSGPGDSFAGLAFALYSYAVDDYGGNSTVFVDWAEQAAGSGEEDYLALANWDKDRWDWFSPGSGGSVSPPSLEPYFAFGGILLACVLRTGSEQSRLDFVRIGSVPPDAQLSADPQGGLPPVTINFDASASSDSDGTVAEYLWDPEGDGSFVSSGQEPLFSHEYSEVGQFSAAVRVVDNDGVYNEARTEISSSAQKVFTFGLPVFDDEPAGIFSNQDGSLTILSHAADFDTEQTRFQFLRFNPAGEVSIARCWTPEEQDNLRDAARAADGSIYACGRTISYDEGRGDGILQKWSADGELLWSRSIGNSVNGEEFSGIIVHGERVYLCGKIALEPTPVIRELGFLLATDLEGAVQWKASLISADSCRLNDLAVAVSLTQPAELRAGGIVHHGEGLYDALFVRFNLDGALLDSQIMGSLEKFEEINAISIGSTPLLTTYAGGLQFDSTGTIGFLSVPGGQTKLLTGVGNHVEAVSMLGRRALIFNTDNSGFSCCVLANFNGALELTSQYQLGTAEDSGTRRPHRLATYLDGRVVLGGNALGSLPAETEGSIVATTDPGLSWSAHSLSIGNPTPIVVKDTPAFTTQLEGFGYNRQQNDRDLLLSIDSFE